MIDCETQKPLAISTDGDAGPYLMVPMEQLPDVRALLRQHQIAHAVDADAIQLNGRAVIAIVNFGRGAKSSELQRLLDAVD